MKPNSKSTNPVLAKGPPIFGPKPDRDSIAQAAKNLTEALKRK